MSAHLEVAQRTKPGRVRFWADSGLSAFRVTQGVIGLKYRSDRPAGNPFAVLEILKRFREGPDEEEEPDFLCLHLLGVAATGPQGPSRQQQYLA